MKHLLGAAALAAGCMLAQAEPTQLNPNGFVSTHRAEVAATPEAVYAAMAQLPRWWSDAHTYSGKAANLSLQVQAGGCFCEHWGEGNSVKHAEVLLVMPGRIIRMQGGFGPLQDLAVNAVLSMVTSAQEGKTFLRFSYRVHGPADAGLEKLAPAVDKVLGEQFARLKRLVETGSAQ